MTAGTAITPHEIVHRSRGDVTVDEWGRDERLIRALSPAAALRWDADVSGGQHVRAGAALLVVNSRRFALTPVLAAWALADELQRPVRFVGRPDVVPFGPVMRRMGGLIADAAEVRGALHDEQVVVIAAAATAGSRHVGAVDPAMIAVAIAQGVPVHPVAAISTPWSRRARVHVDRALSARTELAANVQRRIQGLLDADRTGGGSPS